MTLLQWSSIIYSSWLSLGHFLFRLLEVLLVAMKVCLSLIGKLRYCGLPAFGFVYVGQECYIQVIVYGQVGV